MSSPALCNVVGPPDDTLLLAELTTPGDPWFGESVRRLTRAVCARLGASGATTFDATLITTELYTNAVSHAPNTLIGVRLGYISHSRALVVRVRDGNPRFTPPVPNAEDLVGHHESGRGLRIINSLAAAWGWLNTPGGKDVWALVRA